MRKIIAIVLLLVAYNVFFFPVLVPMPGHGDFLLFEAVVLFALWLMFWPSRFKRTTRYAVKSTVVALAGALMAYLTLNPVSQVLLGLMSLTATLITLYLLLLKSDEFGSVAELIFMPFRVLFAWIERFFNQSSEWGKLRSKLAVNETTFRIIRGVVIAVPLLVVTVALLASADPIFGNLVSRIVTLPEDLFGRIFFSTLLLIALVPLSVAVIKTKFLSPANSTVWKNYPVETTTIVSLLAAVLGVFLVIQFRYLFATVPETELHRFGINTYSEYVRRGFMEMVLVTLLGYGTAALAYMVDRVSQKKTLKWVSVILLFELGLFVASIFRRVYLYQLNHGLTRIRIFGSVFVVYIFGLLLFLALRHRTGTKRQWYLYELGLAVVLVVFTTLIKPDALIADRFPPTVNNEVDYVYLSKLSIEALPGWVKAVGHAETMYSLAPNPTSTPPAEAVRPLIYAAASTNGLLREFQNLTLRYGTKDEYRMLAGPDDFLLARYDRQSKRGWLNQNAAEAAAYRQLKQEIDPYQLKVLDTALLNYINSLPVESRSFPLDRSYDSPLL